ncbi:MAG: cysteine methyltransferase [Deltaproteobacteria bacterium]|nr:cysteine methyltransferase [Deltaproteobacteria bacterium]
MEGRGAIFKTRFGWMGILGGTGGIQRIYLPMEEKEQASDLIRRESPSLCETPDFFKEEIAQIEEYFAGKRKEFQVSLDFSSATPFQRRVYEILLTIPCGEVRSYGWIARKMGNEKALRAVGHANGKNKWPLIVPCHRVVGSNGSLTGFSALGGLDLKARLLQHEGVPISERRVQGFQQAKRI